MLVIVFVLAIILRFLYFPENIYFGFDQARDAFAALEISQGNLKLIGPSTSFEGLHHGVFYYYIITPFYIFQNPEVVALVLRITNAFGIFLIFYLGSVLFNKKVGLIAALLFAISFEQSQFAIYIGNPSPAVLSVGLMYLGLALVIFKKKYLGLPLAFLGLGSAIQFQFALFYLIVPLSLILIIFRESFKMPLKFYLLSPVALIISLSSFLITELKYDFKTTNALLSLVSSGNTKDFGLILQTYFYTLNKILQFNFVGNLANGWLVGVLLLGFLIWFFKKAFKKQLIFLSIWFFSLITTTLVNGGVKDLANNVLLYYPNIGVSLSLLIFVGFLISKAGKIGLVILVAIFFINTYMINSFNPKGTILEINAQPGMLLSNEKRVLDYIYSESQGQQFAVKAITMPFYINTTWSYLFEWYGKNKYGYTPIWNGKNAIGFPGNIKVEEAQEKLPGNRFLIIEPTRGIPPHLINEYLNEEAIFTKVVDEKHIGAFVTQKREKL